ncbi:Flp pilus assembly protein CpaB [Neobacillus notoginsengisoli]|nr:Flp pilus assembly protein CpaB [Neobacillus notoginsengisoli]
MKSKKLWIWSLIFGLVATSFLYILINSRANVQTSAPSSTKPVTTKAEEQEETKTASTKTAAAAEKGAEGNELLPISDGKRAMTIQVTDVQGIAGFIKAGSHVDVVVKLIVPEDAKAGQHDAGTLIVQNAKVLAIGHAADDEETRKKYQMVTLEVNPREGLALGFSTKYELYLMLRKDGDDKLEKKHTHVHEDELHEGVFLK